MRQYIDIFKKIRLILLFGSLFFAVISRLLYSFIFPDFQIFNSLFIVFVSVFVGIITNFIAIKMLFYPRRKRWYWHGLIPANQKKIAENLGEQIEERLLNAKIIMDYIKDNKIISETTNFIIGKIKSYVDEKKNREFLAKWVYNIYKQYKSYIDEFLTGKADVIIRDFIENYTDFETIWIKIKPIILKFFKSRKLKNDIAKYLSSIIRDKGPEIAKTINNNIERWIRKQPFIKRKLFGLGKWMLGLDYYKISDIVKDTLKSPQTGKTIIGFIDKNTDNIEKFLEKNSVKEKISNFYILNKIAIGKIISKKTKPFINKKINSLIKRKKTWKILDEQIQKISSYFIKKIEKRINEPATINIAKKCIPVILKKVPIKKILENGIMKQKTSEIEKLLMKIMGDNFAAIEVLGGIIGGFFGIIMAYLLWGI